MKIHTTPTLRFGWQVKSNIQFIERSVHEIPKLPNCPPGAGIDDGTWFYVQSEDGDLVVRKNPTYRIEGLPSMGVTGGDEIQRDPKSSRLAQSTQAVTKWLLDIITPHLNPPT